MIKYKGEEIGIDIIEQDESHTSKCSFLDEESVKYHDVYVGKRINRGIFRSAKGIPINTDVHEADINVQTDKENNSESFFERKGGQNRE